MKRRRISNLIVIVVLLLLVSGCQKKNDIDIVNVSNQTSGKSTNPAENINVNGSGTLSCSRDAEVRGDLTGTFNYTVVYRNGTVTMLHSIEKVKGNDKKALDSYEEAYNTIKDKYKNLKYYDVSVTRDDDSVIYDSNINYAKIDMDKLIKIEGNKQKVYSDNKLKLKTWIKFAKKMGTTCKGV